jgi:ABC-type nickel/cobalt efflux system permease component RcnA
MRQVILFLVWASIGTACVVREPRRVYVEPPRHEEQHERHEEKHEEHHEEHHDDHHDHDDHRP